MGAAIGVISVILSSAGEGLRVSETVGLCAVAACWTRPQTIKVHCTTLVRIAQRLYPVGAVSQPLEYTVWPCPWWCSFFVLPQAGEQWCATARDHQLGVVGREHAGHTAASAVTA